MTADREPQTESGRRLHDWQHVGGQCPQKQAVPVPCNLIDDVLATEAEARADAAREAREDDLFVIFDGPPGPESGRFVELETRAGRSVSPAQSGATWSQVGDLWQLGPLRSSAAREAQPDPRVEALRDLVRRLMDTQHPAVSTPHGYLCACQTHTDARAALAAPAPPPAGIDVVVLREAFRSAYAIDGGGYMTVATAYDRLLRARLAPQPTADPEQLGGQGYIDPGDDA